MPESGENVPKVYDEDKPDSDGSNTTPESDSGTREANENTPSSKEREGVSAESEGVLKKISKRAAALRDGVAAKITGFGAAAKSFVGYDQYQLLYEKKITIELPYGAGPKNYCRSIKYSPLHCKQNPQPLITVSITPSGSCHHEDTHLFVRFAGYYSLSKK